MDSFAGSLTGRLWRGYADARRRVSRKGSAEEARRIFDVRRRDTEHWNAELAARHDDYRRSVAPVDAPAAIICVSSRPHLLPTVVSDIVKQYDVSVEFVLVTHAPGFDDMDLDAVLQPLAERNVPRTVIARSRQVSLGACLNAAMAETTAQFVAKFDDDDRYGPDYLADALRAHSYAGAGIVGKHSYYAFVEEADRTVLRFPTREFRYSSTLAGGTLVIDRERTDDIRFPDISLGEDRGLIAACHRHGVSTFSADRFNFLQTRSSNNTWRVETDKFLQQSTSVGSGMQTAEVNR